ncbi:MAG TPA: ACP S-malonyltransferase [Beijerinckiaceae bacterium]|nr:ACP S-malonyltransferase [Beijerinckiaceae bacterium]
MAIALVFPGQGSQTIGMGKALAGEFAQARAVFAEVDAALSQNLSALIFEGPESELTLTANAQPALMAVSMAVIAVLESEAGLDVARDVKFVAGHSLGEYSALAAARSFSLSDAARLLRIRGDAMQKAVPVGEGAMAAILGLDLPAVAEIARRAGEHGGVCQAANDNGGGQVVVSGNKAAVALAMELAKGRGAKRAILLPVSAPFHCALMQPAAEAMEAALARVDLKRPAAPLVANVLAEAIESPADIRRRLVEQVTGTVRWADSIAYMAGHGVDCFYEIGAGKVLSGLLRRIAPEARGVAIGGPADLSAFQSPRA